MTLRARMKQLELAAKAKGTCMQYGKNTTTAVSVSSSIFTIMHLIEPPVI